jgi:5-formyltetrahydrofolate cyclo-ligase
METGRGAVVSKALLRTELSARRTARPAAERQRVADRLADLALELCSGAGVVAAYASFGGEPGTAPLRRALRSAGATVLLPVVRGNELAWVVDDGAEPRRGGQRGVPEPTGAVLGVGAAGLLAAGVAVVLMPALAVDAAGVRLGRGGGYYDRLLAGLPAHPVGPLRVALVHDDEALIAVPAERHDARVDLVLAPGLGPRRVEGGQ